MKRIGITGIGIVESLTVIKSGSGILYQSTDELVLVIGKKGDGHIRNIVKQTVCVYIILNSITILVIPDNAAHRNLCNGTAGSCAICRTAHIKITPGSGDAVKGHRFGDFILLGHCFSSFLCKCIVFYLSDIYILP